MTIFLFLLLVIFLLILLLLFIVLLVSWSSLSILLTLWGLGVSLLLAGPLTKPLGQLLGGSLGELVVLLLPGGLEVLGSDNLPATLVKLLPVVVGPGVGSALVLGVHADLGWVLASQGLWVKTLLQGLGSQLSLLPLLQFLEIKFLCQLPLLVVVFVSLKLDDGLEEILNLALQLIRVKSLQLKRLDSDAEGNLLLLLQLLLGLGELLAGVRDGSSSNGLLFVESIGLLGLLSLQHLLPLGLGLLQPLLLLLGLLGLPLTLLLLQLLLLLSLLLVELLLLLGPDLLPLGLLLLQFGELVLLLLPPPTCCPDPGLPPFPA